MRFVQNLTFEAVALVTLVFSAGMIQAQQPTPPPPPPPAPPPSAVTPLIAGGITLSGTVTAKATGFPLPYSTVIILDLGVERFSDAAGHFVLYGVPAGRYKVRIKELGYTPVDTTIVVSPARNSLAFSLEKIPSTLAEVQVTAPPRKCIVPEENGFVDDPELLTVLLEARKNAERERLLRRTYPFEFKLAQEHDTYDLKDSTHHVVYDTASFRSDDDWKYRQGRVVSDDKSKLFGEVRVMRLPTLTDLADQRFLIAHCFKYSGVTNVDGDAVHQIDFAPLPEIATPDVEGSIYIDSANYLIRRAEFRLTKGGTIKPAVLGMKVTTTYRQMLPNVALFDEIVSVQPIMPKNPGDDPVEFRETQQLLSFRFLYNGPPGTDASLVWKKPVVQFGDPLKRPAMGPER